MEYEEEYCILCKELFTYNCPPRVSVPVPEGVGVGRSYSTSMLDDSIWEKSVGGKEDGEEEGKRGGKRKGI